MAMEASLARRYAKALFSIAVEDKQVEKIERELGEFQAAVDAHAELKNYLEDPTILPNDKRDALKGITEKMGLSEYVRNFISLLGEKGRIGTFQAIRRAYRILADEHEGKAIAQVTSATALAPELEKNLASTLSKLTGRTVSLTMKVDPELLGGIVAEVGGYVYDGSLKTQLRTLRERARQ
jgi:F-type H+-transporting ATPase subunit delta